MSELFTTAAPRVGVSTPTVAGTAVLHVLVADGNPETRAVREAELSAAGFRVSVARTAFEAIVKASCHIPDLILLDAAIIGMDAEETGRLLTTCPVTAHIPVVQLAPGRRVPRRTLSRLRRATV
jgi:response regulator RpfG family c-di-GMP phosphodiesterase